MTPQDASIAKVVSITSEPDTGKPLVKISLQNIAMNFQTGADGNPGGLTIGKTSWFQELNFEKLSFSVDPPVAVELTAVLGTRDLKGRSGSLFVGGLFPYGYVRSAYFVVISSQIPLLLTT